MECRENSYELPIYAGRISRPENRNILRGLVLDRTDGGNFVCICKKLMGLAEMDPIHFDALTHLVFLESFGMWEYGQNEKELHRFIVDYLEDLIQIDILPGARKLGLLPGWFSDFNTNLVNLLMDISKLEKYANNFVAHLVLLKKIRSFNIAGREGRPFHLWIYYHPPEHDVNWMEEEKLPLLEDLLPFVTEIFRKYLDIGGPMYQKNKRAEHLKNVHAILTCKMKEWLGPGVDDGPDKPASTVVDQVSLNTEGIRGHVENILNSGAKLKEEVQALEAQVGSIGRTLVEERKIRGNLELRLEGIKDLVMRAKGDLSCAAEKVGEDKTGMIPAEQVFAVINALEARLLGKNRGGNGGGH